MLATTLNAQSEGHAGPSDLSPFDEYASFSEAIGHTEIQSILKKSGSFTVFAPTDAAFKELTDQGLDFQDPNNARELRSLVAYHIVAGEFTASMILRALCRGEGAATFTTIQGEPLIATLEGVDIVLMDCSGRRARIVKADTSAENLVFHEIDTVVLPGPPGP